MHLEYKSSYFKPTPDYPKQSNDENGKAYFEVFDNKKPIRLDSINQVKDYFRDICHKEINAFMNQDGGRLVIGVQDDKKLIGIDREFDDRITDWDTYQLNFTEKLANVLLTKNFSESVEIRSEEIDGHRICIVECKQSQKRPVLMKVFDRDKKRYEGEKAFIREQGRIKEMSPSEIIEMSSNSG